MQRVRERIFEILETSLPDDWASRMFGVFITTLISLNVLMVVLETVEKLSLEYEVLFKTFEMFSVGVFTVEYFLRLWTCTTDRGFEHPIVGRVRFALTPLALIDLMAILPFYLPMIFPLDLRFIRAVRLLRLFRVFKLARYSESLETLGNVLKAKREELVLTLFVTLLLLVFASSLMYYVEREAHPQGFSSIPAAMWWGVATLTTVGYGDVYPITPLGKLLGAVIAILGIGMFALPAGLLASGFAEEIQKKRQKRICPHCGKSIDDPPETQTNAV